VEIIAEYSGVRDDFLLTAPGIYHVGWCWDTQPCISAPLRETSFYGYFWLK